MVSLTHMVLSKILKIITILSYSIILSQLNVFLFLFEHGVQDNISLGNPVVLEPCILRDLPAPTFQLKAGTKGVCHQNHLAILCEILFKRCTTLF